MRKFMTITVFIVLLSVLLSACRTDSPKSVVTNLLEAAANRDVEEGKYYSTTSFVVDSSCLGTDGREMTCYELLMTCGGMSTKELEYLVMSYELLNSELALPPGISEDDNVMAVLISRDQKDYESSGSTTEGLMVFYVVELEEGWSVFNFELNGKRYAGDPNEPFDCNDADWYP